MFDDVTCDYELPDRPKWARSFQTKALNCFMDKYHVHADGRLVERTDWDGAEYRTERPVIWTGGMRFYDCRHTLGVNGCDGWVEYVALFKHGVLVHVELVTLEPSQSAAAVDPHADSTGTLTTREKD